MTDSERLKEIIDSSKMNKSAFSRHIGLSGPQRIYDILNGRYKINEDLAKLIHAKYLNYNLTWIWTGEGNKLSAQKYQDKSFNADDNSVNNTKAHYGESLDLDDLSDLVKSQQRTIENLSKAIERDSETIDRLTKKKDGTNNNGKNASSA